MILTYFYSNALFMAHFSLQIHNLRDKNKIEEELIEILIYILIDFTEFPYLILALLCSLSDK